MNTKEYISIVRWILTVLKSILPCRPDNDERMNFSFQLCVIWELKVLICCLPTLLLLSSLPKIALTRILPQAADQKALNTTPSQLSLMDPLVLSLTSKVSQFILRHTMYKDMIVMTMIFWLAIFSIISFWEDTIKNSVQLLQDTVSYPKNWKCYCKILYQDLYCKIPYFSKFTLGIVQ